MRTLEELIDTADPAWPLVVEWLTQATNPVEVLPVNGRVADEVLVSLQVTTRSPMGAIAHFTGGVLFDHGWLRFLGSGHPRMERTLTSWNACHLPAGQQRLPGAFLVADDAIGGFFALNGGAFAAAQPGHVQYFSPDTLDWQDLKVGYTQLVQWACSGDLGGFYGNSRWPGWETEVGLLSGDTGLSVYPFLWAKGPPTGQRSRQAVPIQELWGVQMDVIRQLASQKSSAA